MSACMELGTFDRKAELVVGVEMEWLEYQALYGADELPAPCTFDRQTQQQIAQVRVCAACPSAPRSLERRDLRSHERRFIERIVDFRRMDPTQRIRIAE